MTADRVSGTPYMYWMLRYVPDSARGEFVNVGLIVGNEQRADWAVRTVPSLSRASRLGGDARWVEDWLARFQAAVGSDLPLMRPPTQSSSSGFSFASLDRIRRHLNNSFQITEPLPLRAADADSAADILYSQLIVESTQGPRSTDRNTAIRELRDAFYNVPELSPKDVQSRVRLQVGRQQARFEFAIGRDRIAQLSHVWSFKRQSLDGLSGDIQATSYVIKRLREDGGLLLNPARTKQEPVRLSRDVPIRVLYVPPSSAVQREIFEGAEEAWSNLGVLPFAVGQEDHLAQEAVSLLHSKAS
ncbi:DUF3037 domain-containing protein [Kribbella sandramycini]|uniref:DUF3037 domain-containing protein n=1 Tax=Kribbella sandramycini TaxID=60450 RepID=A0A7Y4L7D2_9ACTN|nr:DUF3037 domain-containing protein [Kribbella sandramycini]MBB6567005.1 hypothetical protein [Kribbella sandramycini]NOL44727.1 DUF3037 domain-containing protein [Kribbella sandramycini]